MINVLLFIIAIALLIVFVLDVISRRKDRKARNDYIDEIEKSICKSNK